MTAVETLSDRYVKRHAPAAAPVAHLLTATWTERRGGIRPALCGTGAKTWRNVALLTHPEQAIACPQCDHAAELVIPAPRALATKPRGHRGRALTLTAADQTRAVFVDPQHATAALPPVHRATRGGFLRSIPVSDRARLPYAPGPDNRPQDR